MGDGYPGTGSPIAFRCWACRRRAGNGGGSTMDGAVIRTGRERPARRPRWAARGTRSSPVSREYRCSCGHRGWSNHIGLESVALREVGR